MAVDSQLKALTRISRELETLDDAGLRYVIDRAKFALETRAAVREGVRELPRNAVTHADPVVAGARV